MVPHLTSALALLASGVLAFPATAQTTDRAYVRAAGAVTNPRDTRFRLTDPARPSRTDTLRASSKPGWEASAAIGRRFAGDHVAVEVEAVHAQSAVDSITSAWSGRTYQSDDHLRQTSALFVNALAGTHLDRAKRLHVEIGAGAGYGIVSFRAETGEDCSELVAMRAVNTRVSPRTAPSGNVCEDQGRSRHSSVAFQGLVRASYRITPRLRAGLQARIAVVSDVELAGKSVPARITRFRTNRDFTTRSLGLFVAREF